MQDSMRGTYSINAALELAFRLLHIELPSNVRPNLVYFKILAVRPERFGDTFDAE